MYSVASFAVGFWVIVLMGVSCAQEARAPAAGAEAAKAEVHSHTACSV